MQDKIAKGDLMEELLRGYFLSSGYYVARGVKFKYENNDITDIDIFLYGRSSSISRHRVNVDAKNKKTPQAFERILWANGLRKLLNFDSCIVATTDRRPVVNDFGLKHQTIVLDGAFLERLKTTQGSDRLSEEEFGTILCQHKSYKAFPNKDWRQIYEISKSRLLGEMDYSGINSGLSHLGYFIEKAMADEQKRTAALRLIYVLTSHLLLCADYIIKDVAFMDPAEKESRVLHGLKYGNLGKDGFDKILTIALQVSGKSKAKEIETSVDAIPVEILSQFLCRNEVFRNLFLWAREFEKIGYSHLPLVPSALESPLQAVILVLLDYFRIDRKSFFDSFESCRQLEMRIEQKQD